MDREAVLGIADELVPGGADAELRTIVEELDVLARWKYDLYEGYGPGRRFWEHAIAWLRRLEPDERAPALRLLRRRLVFVSRDELLHLVRCAYPDVVRPALLRRLAREGGRAVGPLAGTPELEELERGLVVVGLSDGARLDVLRRAVPPLASAQFVLDQAAGVPADARHVLAVDDFSGTGTSLIREEGGAFRGRLPELAARLRADATGSLLIYVASDRAARHLRSVVPEALVGWDVLVVQELPAPRDSPAVRELVRRHYGVEPSPETKGGRNLGYRGGELPLVLHHNTPNDSLVLLWAPPDGGPWGTTALFPRSERLRPGRD